MVLIQSNPTDPIDRIDGSNPIQSNPTDPIDRIDGSNPIQSYRSY